MGSSSLARDLTRVPALGAWSLGHWTTREVPSLPLIFLRNFNSGGQDSLQLESFPISSLRQEKMYLMIVCLYHHDFPGGRMVKNPCTNAGDARDIGLIPGLERFPGGGNGNPLQSSCLETSMDRGVAWRAAVPGVSKSWTQLNTRALQCYTTTSTTTLPKSLNFEKFTKKKVFVLLRMVRFRIR